MSFRIWARKILYKIYFNSENFRKSLKVLSDCCEIANWDILISCVFKGFWASYGQTEQFRGTYQIIWVLLIYIDIFVTIGSGLLRNRNLAFWVDLFGQMLFRNHVFKIVRLEPPLNTCFTSRLAQKYSANSEEWRLIIPNDKINLEYYITLYDMRHDIYISSYQLIQS